MAWLLQKSIPLLYDYVIHIVYCQALALYNEVVLKIEAINKPTIRCNAYIYSIVRGLQILYSSVRVRPAPVFAPTRRGYARLRLFPPR